MSEHTDPEMQEVTVHVEPHLAETRVRDQVAAGLLGHRCVCEHLTGTGLRLATFDLLDKEGGPDSRFRATVVEPGTGRQVVAHGRVGALDEVTVRPTAVRPVPTEDEFHQAVELALRDERFAELTQGEGVQVYRPMPPHADTTSADGTVERVVTVGLRGEIGDLRHRIVGVRMSDGAVLHQLDGVPRPSASDCEPTPPRSCDAPTGGPDQVRVRVLRGGTTLWDFVLVRPRTSSGTNGSGVELRFVDYRGKRVLYRAHVPILNVQYSSGGVGAGCGPTYRDWLNAETCFHAIGSDPAGPGFRVCSQPPQTILDSGVDGGNFQGVALWYHGGELRLVSQLSAGWYRYISDWRLADDGTIGARFGFAATANPCTCNAHTHHAYWRLDFDIVTAGNNVVEEFNDPPIIGNSHWHTKHFEIRRPRDATHKRSWRVRNRGTLQSYTVQPGPHDGTLDAYGAGDVWVLRYHGNEIDDGHGFGTDPITTRADLDKFVTGEPVEGQDVVLWYAGHFFHDEQHPTGLPHVVGPDLRPVNW